MSEDTKDPTLVGKVKNVVDAIFALIGTQSSIEGKELSEDLIASVTRDVYAENDEIVVNFRSVFKATDQEKRLVTGIVLVPDEVDAHGDIYDAEEVRKAAHDFAANGFYGEGPELGLQHVATTKSAQIVESFIAPDNMLVGDIEVKKGTWLITTKILSDDLWKAVKEGDFTGFSIGGKAMVEDL